MKPSPSSDPHEQGGAPSNKHVNIALIMDCPIITVHAGKCYKALLDSGSAISLVRYYTWHNIDNSLKHTTLIHLYTADGTPMTGLGVRMIQLGIADFKFSHNFIM